MQLALDATLEDAARRAGDSHEVSVALRRSLLRQRASRHRDEEPVRLVRGVLEPHEHQAFDHQLLHLAR